MDQRKMETLVQMNMEKPNLHGVSLPVSREFFKLGHKAVKKPWSFAVTCFGEAALAFEACKLLFL